MTDMNAATDNLEELFDGVTKRLQLRRIDEQLARLNRDSVPHTGEDMQMRVELLESRRRILVNHSVEVRDERLALRMARGDGPSLLRVGLRKMCPRCLRGGWVFIRPAQGPVRASVVVVWDGPALSGVGDCDIDDADLKEMLNPRFGCGQDEPSPRNRTERT